jgi:hypothetical protein
MKIWILLLAASLGSAADIHGDWIAEISAKGADPQYARVKLNGDGTSISGSWNQLTLAGAMIGDRLSFSLLRNGLPAGTLTATASGGGFSGEGKMRGGGRGGAGQESTVSFKLTRPVAPPSGGPRKIDFEPKVFYGYYSAANPPALRVFRVIRCARGLSTPAAGTTIAARPAVTSKPDRFMWKARCRAIRWSSN